MQDHRSEAHEYGYGCVRCIHIYNRTNTVVMKIRIHMSPDTRRFIESSAVTCPKLRHPAFPFRSPDLHFRRRQIKESYAML